VALLELIIEKGYDAVSVRDIVARAKVGRSTFYSHHGSKEALLSSSVQQLRRVLSAQQHAFTQTPGAPWCGFTTFFFAHAGDHRTLYRALGRHGGAFVMAKIRQTLRDLVRAEIDRVLATRRKTVPLSVITATTRFVVDAMISILLTWLDEHPSWTAAQAERLFRNLTLPGVSKLLAVEIAA
jgi:AcrR family transcriptional regulator